MAREADDHQPWPKFLRLWEGVLEEVNSGARTILVEGERDRAALRRLGVRGPVMLVHHGATLSRLAEEIRGTGRPVTVLTDWDTEGGMLARRLRELLPAGRMADLEVRRRLGLLLRREVTHVEGLYRWARRQAEESGAPLDHWFRESTG